MNETTLTVTLPTDADALAMIDQLARAANITGEQAGNVLALRAWIGKLGERLGVEPVEAEAA